MRSLTPNGFGWHRDIPDFRDYTLDHPTVQESLGKLPIARGEVATNVDLRDYFPDVDHQLHLNSSAAHACLRLVEYFDRRTRGEVCKLSRLFLYRSTRTLMQVSGDVGADLRTTLKALVRFGLPPERLWPYQPDQVDTEPPSYLYSFTEGYRNIRYVRLDAPNSSGSQTLQTVKSFLRAGFPIVFGFSVPGSISRESDVHWHRAYDAIVAGQAVVAVGYDDRRLRATRGALLFRNSWGNDWGEDGYGWLPYTFVEDQLAVDFWAILRDDWLSSGEFTKPP